MEEILRKNFEANPAKSTIVLKDNCSDCDGETIVHITPTSGGFGLQGGAVFKNSSDEYIVKCRDCYQISPKMSSRNLDRICDTMKLLS